MRSIYVLLKNIGANLEDVKKLVRNPKFICKGWVGGRERKHLCAPEKL